MEQSVIQFAVGLQRPARVAELLYFPWQYRQINFGTTHSQIRIPLLAIQDQVHILVFKSSRLNLHLEGIELYPVTQTVSLRRPVTTQTGSLRVIITQTNSLRYTVCNLSYARIN